QSGSALRPFVEGDKTRPCPARRRADAFKAIGLKAVAPRLEAGGAARVAGALVGFARGVAPQSSLSRSRRGGPAAGSGRASGRRGGANQTLAASCRRAALPRC